MKNNKQFNLIFGGIIVIILAFIVLVSTGVISFNKAPSSKVNPDIEVSEKDEVLALLGLTENGYKRLDEEAKQKYELEGDNFIDYSFYDIAKIFMDLKAGEYKVKDFNKDQLNSLIFNYGLANSVEFENIDSSDPSHPCYGTVGCFGIKEEDYKKIASLYGFSDIMNNVLQKYGEIYLLYVFPTVDNPHEISDKLSMKYLEDAIEAKYDVSIKPTQDYNQSGVTLSKILTYTLKKNADSTYYLESIKVEDK